MRKQLDSFWSWGDERYTGIVLGNFFWVTYHSGYERNRRITNEKNRAFGYVADCHGSTMVHCVRSKGYLDPIAILGVFMLTFCLAVLFCWLSFFSHDIPDMKQVILTMPFVISIVCTIFGAIISYIQTGMTERGIYGRYVLMALLHHPEDPQNHIEDYE
jgi:hypothetical protein